MTDSHPIRVLVVGSRCPFTYEVFSRLLETFLSTYRRDDYLLIGWSNDDGLAEYVVRHAMENQLNLIAVPEAEAMHFSTVLVALWDGSRDRTRRILEHFGQRALKTHVILI